MPDCQHISSPNIVKSKMTAKIKNFKRFRYCVLQSLGYPTKTHFSTDDFSQKSFSCYF